MNLNKKLRLEVEALEVETFGVLPEGADAIRGTVEGQLTGFRGSACTDCGGGGFEPDTGDTGGGGPVVESMMEYNTCGAQFSCQPYGWCGETLQCPSQVFQPSGCSNCWGECV